MEQGKPESDGQDKRIVRVRGLPFTAEESEIKQFFAGYPIEQIKWSRTLEGRHNGVCHVIFTDATSASNAMSKNKQYIGSRYVELFLEDINDMDKALNRGPNSNKWLKVRGAPFQSTTQEIAQFFDGLGITLPEVHLMLRQGRPSGEAIARFSSEKDTQVALTKNKQNMGARYIELVAVDDAEAELIMTRMTAGSGTGDASISSNLICLLRGLPFRATTDDVKKFFEGIDIGPVHIRFDRTGRPSGEAFVEMRSPAALEAALARNRNSIGGRYIEVYKVEKDEAARKLGLDGRDRRRDADPSPYGHQGHYPVPGYQSMPPQFNQPSYPPAPQWAQQQQQQQQQLQQQGLQVNIDPAALAAAAATGQHFLTIQVPTQTLPTQPVLGYDQFQGYQQYAQQQFQGMQGYPQPPPPHMQPHVPFVM